MLNHSLRPDSIARAVLHTGGPPLAAGGVERPIHAFKRLALDLSRIQMSETILPSSRIGPALLSKPLSALLEENYKVDEPRDGEILSDLIGCVFEALTHERLTDCTVLQILPWREYGRVIDNYEPDRDKAFGLAFSDGCFVGGFACLVKGNSAGNPGEPRTWKQLFGAATHELGHRVFWPSDDQREASEVSAEFFRHSAWAKLRTEAKALGDDIGDCPHPSEQTYRRLSLRASELLSEAIA